MGGGLEHFLRFRLQPWRFLLLLAIVLAASLFGIDWYRHRYVRNEGDLLSLLPPGKSQTVFFADVAALRQGGFLRLLAGAKPVQEKDYDAFVRETGLDYTQDLDEVAGATDDQQLFFVMRGHFDWDRVRKYVLAHGGSCPNGLCGIATSRPGRWVSFLRIQSDVIGLAVSGNGQAAEELRPPGKHSRLKVSAPVWIDVSPGTLSRAPELMAGARSLTQPLKSAESVLIALARADESSRSTLIVRVEAGFSDETSAEVARNQLQLDTKLLKLELSRERKQPNPADLTGLLTSGSFEVAGRRVIGIWPLSKELLASLQ
jgi:hypothetical protein